MTTPRELDHVYVWTSDMERAVRFYRDTLGLALLKREGDDWAELDAGPIRLGLHGGDGDRPRGGTAVFRVEDLDAVRLALEERGVVFEEKVGEVPGYARFATFADPDGNVLQLIEYGPATEGRS